MLDFFYDLNWQLQALVLLTLASLLYSGIELGRGGYKYSHARSAVSFVWSSVELYLIITGGYQTTAHYIYLVITVAVLLWIPYRVVKQDDTLVSNDEKPLALFIGFLTTAVFMFLLLAGTR